MESVKLPVPVPLSILPSVIVGVGIVKLQHKPRAEIVAPPSEVTFPSYVAEAAVILVTEDKLTVGIDFMDSFLQLKINENRNPEIRIL